MELGLELQARFSKAEMYLDLLEKPGGAAWLDRAENALDDKLVGPELYALLHPQWLTRHLRNSDIGQILGPERFARRLLGSREGRCQSALLWGYKCKVTHPGDWHGDHLFPRAAGGSTTAANLVILCNRHNLMKSSDVHLYPHWDTPAPWVHYALRARVAAMKQVLYKPDGS